MSVRGTELSLQFPAANLLGCGQASHAYLCDKPAALNKHLTSSCLGALYKQRFDLTRTLCPMKIITSGEILYQLDDNWQLVYSPKGQTLNIICPTRQAHKPHQFIPEWISKFQLPPGCRTELDDHFVYSDSSISSDSGLEHIKLPDVVSLNIPNVSPEYLEAIMADMTKDGMYRPTMNDIIKAHEHMQDLSHQTSLSMIVWNIFAIVIILLLPSHYISFITFTRSVPLFPPFLNSSPAKPYILVFPHFSPITLYIHPLSKTNPPNPFPKQGRDIVK